MIAAIQNNLVAAWHWRAAIWLGVCYLLNNRARGSKMAMFLALLEPLVLIAIFYFLRAMVREGLPQYGTSLLLFLCSGLLPFFMFIRISTHTRSVNVGPRSRLPGLSALDVYIANVIAHSIIWITMIVAIFLAMWLYGIRQARPASIVDCAAPILLLILLATGVGMINNVIVRYVRVWATLYPILMRVIIFLSGVWVVVDLLPLGWRWWCMLNPLSHAIEWFRLGVYGIYPHNSLDQAYLLEWTLVVLFLGFIIDRAALRKLDS